MSRWQGAGGQEGIVARVDHQRGHGNVHEPGLAARACPVVIHAFEAVQWRGNGIVELPQSTRRTHASRVEKAGMARQFIERFGTQGRKEMACVKAIESRSES